MSSRIENDLLNFRKSLEKFVGSDDNNEQTKDILVQLDGVVVNIDLLRTTKIGQTLQELKKKHMGNEIGVLVKNLLSKWRKQCESGDAQPGVSPKSSSSSAATSSKSENNEEEELDESMYDHLPATRRKIMDLFVDVFKGDAKESVAKFISFNIEYSVNNLHSATADPKAYLNKSRSLAFNLKKNERLRKGIMEGAMPADRLVHLSTSELATDEIRGERAESTKQADLARRGDLYEITRAAILSANGIDPNKGGEFCCRRCKGTKTTHYAMQTRSSDEPMTIFVCCLTCGNRWRS